MGLVSILNAVARLMFKDNFYQNTFRLFLGASSAFLECLGITFAVKLIWNVFGDVDAFLKVKGDHSFSKRGI